MPCFLVPIHEFNKCHNPEGEGGGRFCSTAGASPQAQFFAPGEAVDLVAAAGSGDSSARKFTRRFLFNPKTGAFVIGKAVGTVGRDMSHADAFDAATRQHNTGPDYLDSPNPNRLDYDDFTVHGHLLADTPASPLAGTHFASGPLALQIDRIASLTRDARDREVEKLDAFHTFLQWTTRHGAGPTTPLYDMSFSGQTPAQKQAGGKLGKMYPDLFPKAKRVRTPAGESRIGRPLVTS